MAGLVLAGLGLKHIRLGFPLIRALPATSQEVRAEQAAARGFVPGILSPTEVLVLGPGVAGRPAALRRGLPALARAAGLTGVRVEVGGETALVGEAIDAAVSDLTRVAVVIALVILVLLALLLRAVVAPFYLLAASVLALLAALGLTVWIFQGLLHYNSLVYYVPFVVAVLLISLGSDYNVFVVGRIWEEARRRPIREAVAVAAPRASRAITTAGLALAAGFGMLALVPLAQFREIALAMALGVLLDTFVVRSLLVPALVVLFGRVGSWPGRTVPPPRRLSGSPAAEDLHGTVAHRD